MGLTGIRNNTKFKFKKEFIILGGNSVSDNKKLYGLNFGKILFTITRPINHKLLLGTRITNCCQEIIEVT